MTTNRFDVAQDDGYLATTTVTSFRIIEALKRRDGATVQQLVEELGLASGTVYKHLNTLQSIQYVDKDGSEYRLGLGFLELGIAARTQRNLYNQTYDSLESLAETTGGVTTLMVPEHGFGVYLTQIVPSGATTPPHQEGERAHLHATAGGKVILAYQPTETVESWLENRTLPSLTPFTISDPEELQSELQSVRDRRAAHSRREQFEEWHAVAAPVTDDDDEAICAVGIKKPVDPNADTTDMSEFKNLLGSTVSSIESKLRFR
ncbi:IclR family transcriptional regulator [Haloferax sp. AS1]|uniref:IclR family transcriptional regulator n=1 Tax=Haloferax TaxID=2251 RepID=UPI0005B1E171|nr:MULTISPECIES: IclR family transcriptional regulator [unclassified Haloferax]MBC9987922.1 IclR family transcriptional regulator [Haloferax sp. AS1]